MLKRSATARRLLAGFGLLVLLFAATAGLTASGLGRIHASLTRARADEEGVRLALTLASAVREEYAHQAHTIILGNRSHLPLYAAAERRVLELAEALHARAQKRGAREEQAVIADIEEVNARLGALFRERIVPAVVANDRAYVQEEHARAQLLVSQIQDDVERLAASAAARIDRESAAAAAVERRTYGLLLAMLFGAPLLAVLVVVAVGRSIAGPMARLRAGAERIGEGKLDTRITVTSQDEFGALASKLNAMAEALGHHQEKLVQSEKLAGVGRLAAGVAHEINNPLGVILGYLKLLRRRADRALDEDLAVVEEEAHRCQEIVSGLLDLSRPALLARVPVSLRELCLAVESLLREAGVLASVSVRVEGAAAALASPGKLRQVVENLLRNAAEAAGPGGWVRVAIESADGFARLSVEDSGPGLSPTVRERLFEPFFTTRERGTGLGLAVSRAIARAHGGELTAGGAAGGGARFTLRLPAPAAGGDAVAPESPGMAVLTAEEPYHE